MQRKAVCLVSGGMDSAVVLAEARAAGFRVYALSFRYGQRHAVELEAAARVARAGGAEEHRIVDVDLSALGGSALTADIAVPKDRADLGGGGVPVTYVPARNTIFLAVALGWAEVLGATDLFVGVNAVDYSGYPDCRPEFLRAFERLAALATAAGTERGARFTVHAPLMELSKAGIVARGRALGVDFALTHTCYDPRFQAGRQEGLEVGRVLACGRCDACRLRLAGFRELGLEDPIPYENIAGAVDAASSVTPLATKKLTDPRLAAFERLLSIVDRLRAPDGCPWDRAQTEASMAPHLVEEALELVEAIECGDVDAAAKELGDCLVNVLLVCRIAEDGGRYDLARAASLAADKLVHRHPHVFGDAAARTPDEVLATWESIKRRERERDGDDTSALAGVPRNLPALQRAARVCQKAVASGFHWRNARGAFGKVEEELVELREVLPLEKLEHGTRPELDDDERAQIEHELGDVLLATAFLGGYMGLDPEALCRRAVKRFEARYRHMEQGLGGTLAGRSLDEMMAAWGRAKLAVATREETDA
jgi:7-cyano-7-deazaguanine synthase